MSNSLTPLNYDCFTNIIGLSDINCDCFDDNLNWDESYSGLYLDKAEGVSLQLVDSIKDCSNEDNIWLIMNTARDTAIRKFVSDTNMRLLQKYQLARSNFYGMIGRQDFKKDRIINSTYAGVRIATANVVGGWMKLKGITTIFAAAGVRDLYIYNNLNELLYTIPVNTANGKIVNTCDITLPLWDIRTKQLEYFLVYSVDPAIPCKNNDVNCSSCTGIKYIFDTERPYFNSKSNRLAQWSKWVMVGEWSGDTLDFSDVCSFAENYMNGLALQIDFYCDLSKQYCFDTPDINDPVFISVAFAIWHLSAYNTILKIIGSPNVNRYTMLGTEALDNYMKKHMNDYNELIDWLIKNANTSNTDCIMCRDNIKMGIGVL